MYDEPSLPYRCPICMQPVSPCTEDATTGKRTCGCLTYSCPAPIFTQKMENQFIWHLSIGITGLFSTVKNILTGIKIVYVRTV